MIQAVVFDYDRLAKERGALVVLFKREGPEAPKGFEAVRRRVLQ